MEVRTIGYVIHDGWEVRFRENGEEVLRNIEPYVGSIRRFLMDHPKADILSMKFWGARMSVPESAGIYTDTGGRFFERSFTINEIAELPDNWLQTIRGEIELISNSQLLKR